jgi:beta-glucosidase
VKTALLPDIETLSLAQQVAQMLVVRASGYLFDHQIQYPAWEPPISKLKYWLKELGVGGVILLGGSAAEVALRIQQLQDWAYVPLLVSADIEEGVGQRFAGATWFPPPMALGTIAENHLEPAELYAQQMGALTAQEALAIGINWVLAPVVDVNNNPANPVINVRAFGRSPEIVSHLATAFIRGAQQYPVLTVAKHFPGHGDTATDSHLDLPVLPHSWERLTEVELPSFQAAIAAGVDSIMSAHLLIPSLDSQYPATLSPRILTQELRQNLGFEGLIVTDALVMGAIADRYGCGESAVLAVEAGADILLMPPDAEVAIQAVCEAVETGRIAPERIQASVERIWRAKFKVCAPQIEADSSHRWESVPPAPIQFDQLAQAEAMTTVTDILQHSMQVYHPVLVQQDERTTEHSRNLIVVDDALACDFLGRNMPAIVLPQEQGYTSLQLIDCHTPCNPQMLAADGACPTLLQLFIRGNPFRGSAGLTQTATEWFRFLLQTNQLQALIIYGSPYVLEQFLPELPATVPYVFTYGQMPEAQAIALKALFDR